MTDNKLCEKIHNNNSVYIYTGLGVCTGLEVYIHESRRSNYQYGTVLKFGASNFFVTRFDVHIYFDVQNQFVFNQFVNKTIESTHIWWSSDLHPAYSS